MPTPPNAPDHTKSIIRIRIESLIEKNDLWALDCFLQKHVHFGHDDLLTATWKTGQEGKHTWLTDAVSNGLWEIVAILLFYGADPHQNCPQHRHYNAFDYLLNFRPYRDYGMYYFGATLLNTTTNTTTQSTPSLSLPLRTANYLAHMYPQDRNEPLGANVNALMPDMDPTTIQFIYDHPQDAETILQTALMYAADNVYPYCTRWLLRGRKAKVNVSALVRHHHDHHRLDAMYFALQRFPATTLAADKNYYDQSLFNWWLMVHELLHFKANPFKWQETFPWACAAIQEYVETVQMTPQHLLARTLVWPYNVHFP